MAKKNKTSVKPDKNFASITMQINHAHFHAEGDSAEVSEKFREWLDQQFSPVRMMTNVAIKVLKADGK
jgi:hypothetical protein